MSQALFTEISFDFKRRITASLSFVDWVFPARWPPIALEQMMGVSLSCQIEDDREFSNCIAITMKLHFSVSEWTSSDPVRYICKLQAHWFAYS